MRILALILAACAAGTLNWSGAAHCAAAATAPSEQRLPHISVKAIGSGPPVLLLPGLSTPRDVWDGIAPELARGHRVILVQVNGFAGDDPGANLQPGMLDGIADDLHRYIGDHRLKGVRLVGHSMGGLVGLKLALAHPEDLQKLMIVDALPFFGALMDESATADAVRPIAQMMKSKVSAAYGKPADGAAAEANVRSLALKPTSTARMKSWAMAADPRVTAQALYEDMVTDLRPALAKLKTPVTLVYPYDDDGAKTLAFYKRQYAPAKVEFVGVGEAGHFVMLDQPERFAAAVEAFVR